MGRDAGGNALGGLDRQRKVGALLAIGLTDHQRQSQLRAALARQRQADQATAIAGHEIDVFGAGLGRRHEQIAFVLAILVVDDDHHLAGSQVSDNVLNGIEGRSGAAAVGGRIHPPSLTAQGQQPLQVARHLVHFDIHT